MDPPDPFLPTSCLLVAATLLGACAALPPEPTPASPTPATATSLTSGLASPTAVPSATSPLASPDPSTMASSAAPGSSAAPVSSSSWRPTGAASSPASVSSAMPAATGALAPLLPEGPVALPPLFEALFRQGQRMVYTYTIFVDPHAPGPIDRTPERAKVTCTIAEVQRLRGAVASRLECEEPRASDGSPGPGSDLPDRGEVFIATAKGLWLASTLPTSDQEAASAVAGPPYLIASPRVHRKQEAPEPGGLSHRGREEIVQQERRPTPGGKSALVWCRRDQHWEAYGALDRRCFSAAHGLVFRQMDGRSGPSQETMTLEKILR